ncbi:Zinc finger BED domain-containing protein DAYSLEEPER [Fusarium oxysporum f. sp. rapae]|uniref:Zinc finger BED domain-containing protein DAYSLEEPER n=1 Tax=Fusarium oxysporum f. sp. rapae TaxID=485398 RepID=A0A8J5NM53_FUSOX|nr:Zinc finger BED domain-containing protein DAYSLEEPER [Fusarium oxysporum f. sp. rapae]
MASSQTTAASTPSISDQPITGTSLDFSLFFKATYPDEDTQNATGGSRKRKSRGMVMYRCLHCPADKPWANRKRDNAWHHARRCHADIISSLDRTLIGGSSDVLDDEREATRPRIDAFFPSRYSDVSLRRMFDRDRYLDAIISLITRRRLAFSAINWDEMQEIMLAANPAIEDLLVTNRSALMRLIDATYELYSSQLMATLEASISKIHILSDLWTSPHRHGILAISARWVDQDYQPQRALLAMPECRYSHSGETQASLIIDTLAKYGIASKVGYHVGDNATSNDTCLSYLSRRLRDDYGLTFDPSKRRIRCVAHIINLSLQAFLLASSKEALIAALDATDDTSNDQLFAQFYDILHDAGQTTRTDEAHQRRRASRRGNRILENFTGWQHIVPLRKVHNIAVWIRKSTLHSAIWDDEIKLRLGIDNATRWNSWYRLELQDDILLASEWEFIERTHRFLQPFASATLLAEGARSTLSQSLSIMDVLLRQYEKYKELYSSKENHDPHMVHCIDMGWFVLNKYYTVSDQTPVYAAALLLDPSKRRKYIERNWQESWHAPAIAAAQQIWLDEYNAAPIPESLRVPLDVSSSSGRQHNELDELLSDIAVTGPILDDADDFETFIDAPPTRITGSPLQWWLHRDQRKAYPRLSRMAIDILSIPPESSDVESHFSSARRTLSWDRESMTCENLAKVECVGNWMREGIIVPKSHGGRGVISSVAVEFSVETEAEDFLD